MNLRSQIRKALQTRAPIGWLLRTIVMQRTENRRAANAARREALNRLVVSMWPQLRGETQAKVEAIRLVGVRQGIWSETTGPYWAVVNAAKNNGFEVHS